MCRSVVLPAMVPFRSAWAWGKGLLAKGNDYRTVVHSRRWTTDRRSLTILPYVDSVGADIGTVVDDRRLGRVYSQADLIAGLPVTEGHFGTALVDRDLVACSQLTNRRLASGSPRLLYGYARVPRPLLGNGELLSAPSLVNVDMVLGQRY